MLTEEIGMILAVPVLHDRKTNGTCAGVNDIVRQYPYMFRISTLHDIDVSSDNI